MWLWGCLRQVEGDRGKGMLISCPFLMSAQAVCSTDSLGNSGCISPNDSVRDSNQLPPPLPSPLFALSSCLP